MGMISGIVGALAGGRLVDRLGAGVMVRVSLAGRATGMAAVSVARGWLFLLLALSAVGLFVAALRVGAIPVVWALMLCGDAMLPAVPIPRPRRLFCATWGQIARELGRGR